MEYFNKVKKVLWVILFANMGVAIIKIGMGSIIKSTSMVADGFHSFTDGASNVVGLIGVHLAHKPEDKEHPYGHKKIENLTGLFIGGMLLFIGGKIIINAIARFITPVEPVISVESLIMLGITLIVNIIIATYEYRQGKKMKSSILISDSIHTKSDIFVSIGVLTTLLCVRVGLPSIIDPMASLIVAGFIFHAAYEIIVYTTGPLLDQAVIEPEQIRRIVLEFAEIKDVHEIRSRGRADEVYVDLHIVIKGDMNVLECHRLTDEIEEKLKSEFNADMEVYIRIEPFYLEEPTQLMEPVDS